MATIQLFRGPLLDDIGATPAVVEGGPEHGYGGGVGNSDRGRDRDRDGDRDNRNGASGPV